MASIGSVSSNASLNTKAVPVATARRAVQTQPERAPANRENPTNVASAAKKSIPEVASNTDTVSTQQALANRLVLANKAANPAVASQPQSESSVQTAQTEQKLLASQLAQSADPLQAARNPQSRASTKAQSPRPAVPQRAALSSQPALPASSSANAQANHAQLPPPTPNFAKVPAHIYLQNSQSSQGAQAKGNHVDVSA
jgi:hypothetical protein